MFLTKSGPQVINYEIHCDFNKRITDLSRLLQWGEEKTTWTSLHLKADAFYLLLGVVDTQSKFRQLSSPSNVNWDVDVLMGVFFLLFVYCIACVLPCICCISEMFWVCCPCVWDLISVGLPSLLTVNRSPTGAPRQWRQIQTQSNHTAISALSVIFYNI